MSHGFYSFVSLLEDSLVLNKNRGNVVGKYSYNCQKDRQPQKIKYCRWLRNPNHQLVDVQNPFIIPLFAVFHGNLPQ